MFPWISCEKEASVIFKGYLMGWYLNGEYQNFQILNLLQSHLIGNWLCFFSLGPLVLNGLIAPIHLLNDRL